MKHRVIGYSQRTYAIDRNFLKSPVPDAEFVPVRNLFRYPNFILFRGFGYSNPIVENLNLGASGADILHFFNRLSVGKLPWVTTFERVLPRWDEVHPSFIPFGLRLIAGKPCRRLIALSACARDYQLGFLEEWPAYADAVAPKVTIVHPAQPILADAPRSTPSGEIRFAFVGGEFFRKGGGDMLRAFDRLLTGGAPIHLTIVSTLAYGDGESHATQADQDEARRIIAKWPDRIAFRERLPNDAVLDLFKQSHVALLPTWADSYGYSVLEAQAAGCPVLSTDVRALPEINDDNCGWVIPVEKDRFGNTLFQTAAGRERLSAAIQSGIEREVAAMIANPAQIATKSANALARIRDKHCPTRHGEALRAIYDEALD